jgi:hypothetical protein
MISVWVSRSGTTGFVTSEAFGPIAAESTAEELTGIVTINGTPVVGETLTAVTSALNGSGTIFYQWLRGGASISGAAGQTYILAGADYGQTISVQVSRSGNTGTVTSVPTAEVAYPAISGTVTISGSAIVGQTLTANANILNGSGDVSYQWLRGGTSISGATGQTYTLEGDDQGQTISVRVRRPETTGFVSSVPTAEVTYPVLSGTLTIVGDPAVGQLLTATTAGFNGSGLFTYQWRRGESNITGATSQTYTLTGDDLGYVIRVRVSRAQSIGTVTSAPTAEVIYPALSGTVTIVGDPVVGQTLTAAPSGLNGIGDGAVSYEWLRGGSTVIGTNSNIYTLTNADQGSAITVRITRVYTTGSISSVPTATVVFPALTGTVTISGTAIVGQTLTAVPSGLNGIDDGAVSYQWLRGGSTAIGTNSSTYTLVSADEGQTIQVQAAKAYTTGTLTSAATAAVVFPVINGTATISGTAIVGQTLTANASISNGNGPYSYQWLRGGSTPIGTNTSTYTIVSGDLGQTIQVRVTRSETTGNVTSAATGTVLAQPQETVSFTFTGPGDESISLTNQFISWTANTPLSFTVSGSYTSYQWSLDGTPISGATTASLSRTARNFSIGAHNLSVRVTNQGGTPYSKEVTITVSN